MLTLLYACCQKCVHRLIFRTHAVQLHSERESVHVETYQVSAERCYLLWEIWRLEAEEARLGTLAVHIFDRCPPNLICPIDGLTMDESLSTALVVLIIPPITFLKQLHSPTPFCKIASYSVYKLVDQARRLLTTHRRSRQSLLALVSKSIQSICSLYHREKCSHTPLSTRGQSSYLDPLLPLVCNVAAVTYYTQSPSLPELEDLVLQGPPPLLLCRPSARETAKILSQLPVTFLLAFVAPQV